MSSRDKPVNVKLTPEEIALLVNTLSIAKSLFQSSAKISIDGGDRETFNELINRVNACNIFIDRLVKNIEIGEPSDTMH